MDSETDTKLYFPVVGFETPCLQCSPSFVMARTKYCRVMLGETKAADAVDQLSVEEGRFV